MQKASPDHALPSVAEVVEAALPRARWFAGKGSAVRVRALVALPWLTGPDLPAVRLEIAEVVNADDPRRVEHYLVPLSYRSASDPIGPGLGVATHASLGPVSVHDATADPYAGDVLLQLVASPHEITGDDVRLVCSVLDTGRLRPGLPARRFGGEQSNTSIMFADVAMLKFFRRLEFGGENLDIEIHRELAGGPAAARVAGLMSWLTAEWTDFTGRERRADLGMLVEQVPGAADGWDLAVTSVSDKTDFSEQAAELGHALREVHAGLAEAFGTTVVSGTEQAAAMRQRLVAAIADVDEITPLHGALDSRLARLGDVQQTVQRIHGDFHLGQVLLARKGPRPGWRIIDFEGEPLKTLAERREPDTVWRDVAGLLRSFDYAGAFAVRSDGADPHMASAWVAACQESFLRAYAGRTLTPDEQHILQAYQIDKAAYECRYEKRNRPDWLSLPLAALATLAADSHTAQPRAATRPHGTEPHAFEGDNHGR
ncbi:maltokinase N-terminal cap-like domain-containing protein [Granulicoccus sp. GXG6511]|uniref:maltokinase N-terminal cap-like domain-containing protein n=1 Tax=Granulicoccus sp. GXG6511 TaxID=3381351 RepID=UPI003D7EA1B3